jgi:hypothetical protein
MRLSGNEDIKKNGKAELNSVLLEASVNCFQKPFKRHNTCTQVGGDYFEQKYINVFIFMYFLLFSHQYWNFIARPCICFILGTVKNTFHAASLYVKHCF